MYIKTSQNFVLPGYTTCRNPSSLVLRFSFVIPSRNCNTREKSCFQSKSDRYVFANHAQRLLLVACWFGGCLLFWPTTSKVSKQTDACFDRATDKCLEKFWGWLNSPSEHFDCTDHSATHTHSVAAAAAWCRAAFQSDRHPPDPFPIWKSQKTRQTLLAMLDRDPSISSKETLLMQHHIHEMGTSLSCPQAKIWDNDFFLLDLKQGTSCLWRA